MAVSELKRSRDLVSPIVPQGYKVLDMSVLVSGILLRNGAELQILQSTRPGDVRIAVSVALVLEYDDQDSWGLSIRRRSAK